MAEGTGLSAGDIMALTKDNSNGFGENWIWIIGLLIIAGIFGGGNGFFGGKTNSDYVTQAQLADGLYNQTVDRNLADIRTAQCATDREILNTASATNMAIANNNYDQAMNFKNLQAQMASCCLKKLYAIFRRQPKLVMA